MIRISFVSLPCDGETDTLNGGSGSEIYRNNLTICYFKLIITLFCLWAGRIVYGPGVWFMGRWIIKIIMFITDEGCISFLINTIIINFIQIYLLILDMFVCLFVYVILQLNILNCFITSKLGQS